MDEAAPDAPEEERPSADRSARPQGFRTSDLAALFLAFAAGSPWLRAQDPPPDGPAKEEPVNAGRGFDPYLKLVKSEYIPPDKAGGKQLLRLTLDLADSLPVGARIQMKLQYTSLDVDETVLEVTKVAK